MTAPVTFDLKEETVSALEAFAAQVERPSNELVNEVLDDWLAFQHRQIEKIKEGLAELDRGEAVSQEEMERLADKYQALA